MRGLRIAAAWLLTPVLCPSLGFASTGEGLTSPHSGKDVYERIKRESYGLGPWRLKIERDGFSGDVRCVLGAQYGRLVYQPGAVGFDVGGETLLDAMIRVDGAKVVSFRDLLPELAASRAKISGPDMDRPTDGLVWVPVARLETASRVAISPHFGGKVRHYSIEGLERLVAYARSQSCEPDGTQH